MLWGVTASHRLPTVFLRCSRGQKIVDSASIVKLQTEYTVQRQIHYKGLYDCNLYDPAPVCTVSSVQSSHQLSNILGVYVLFYDLDARSN